ncbi:MAG: hypothetical protein K6E19_01875 [Lachnospiraceae bacterium]|nr:hypothetical protein [Lachnospiraceae bacterium]
MKKKLLAVPLLLASALMISMVPSTEVSAKGKNYSYVFLYVCRLPICQHPY